MISRAPQLPPRSLSKLLRYLATTLICCIIASIDLYAVDYYVDSEEGKDRWSGTSPSRAWKSLKRVNQKTFEAGDRILLRAGSVWKGQLSLRGEGQSGRPITLSTYGDGDRPLIEGEGKRDYTLLLRNVQYWEVSGIEITNTGKTRGPGRRGVIVQAEDFGESHHIHLSDLVIRDVNGSLRKKEQQGGSGILVRCEGKEVPSRFVDLMIENCHILRCERNGINFSGNYQRDSWFPSLQVVIRGNLLEGVPGDGIVPIGCDGALVEHNVMRDCPDVLEPSEAAAGIWPWSSDNTIIQYNEVSGHNAKWDGQGFDADFNSFGTVIQYNYSHDNAGGFILICNRGDTLGTPGNMGTKDTVVRYNVSVNDGIREYPTKQAGWFTPVFHITGPVENTKIYNNLIILPKKRIDEIDSEIVHFNNWGGPWPKDTLFANNIFIAEDSVGFHSEEDEGTVYTNNCYFGTFERLPDDEAAILEDPALADASARGDGFEILKAFMLRSDSPCIEAGLQGLEDVSDLFGNVIGNEAVPSVGIHQF
ncbi:right-handed parallel beta-helix repeat-containing protein [Pelagicoccus mobilis]|uniref:Right-handed parallel beta-helix repeat-containing protein n=1 Tax=Pelagicoccus mobilis TaxID=415221 RepID=A0A934RT28_9BACT|nr:right-handed parallel beta-helix repeat-containing protein [Pelagicoccus mobilis]MBK1875861.1 right-handed parallel beta-helix repeat-containing protein [Pelagicoccus mobilis]